jgi:hypothetical protein
VLDGAGAFVTQRWITDYVDAGDFTGLFVEELGWQRPARSGRRVTVEAGDQTLELSEAATFRGVSVWACASVPSGKAQREVDRQLRKESAERIVIFHDAERQMWRWPQSRDAAGAGAARLVTHEHRVGRSNEALRQRLKFIELGIDEDITVPEVVRRLHRAFDSDRVTKSFYAQFARQHRELTEVITGIEVSDDVAKPELRWYGSLLLNRLMFIYFMQRKGFLDNDPDYLRNRLVRLKGLERPGSFYEFYKDFLIPLFHEGLGADLPNREVGDPVIERLLGDIPYINGGIFSEHPLEIINDIRVPDEAFEQLFDFFDQWQWHLDDRPTGNPNEINPDVLGYIFEQFVNNREEVAKGNKSAATNADKGAYYTKEDVTGYMTSSTLVPAFLEKLADRTGVNPWSRVAADPERYIWASVSHGCETELPGIIAAEENAWPRPSWDTHEVPADLGLPAESWWEVVDRRNHFMRVCERARAGGITTVADAITNNLDLETLAVDVIDVLDSPDDVFTAWQILTELKVIDPTCGSGAFLFAALNILHRLYSAVLDAADLHAVTSGDARLKHILNQAAAHPDRDYFLLKHAALDNLYGVDLMPEAVEIARLRLFLKLIAQIDKRADVEPLPDLEFNIRPGNVLVGALDEEAIRDKVDLLTAARVDELVEAAAQSASVYREFAVAQEEGDYAAVAVAKAALQASVDDVRAQLDEWWREADDEGLDLPEYRRTYSPFHWFVEFPEVFAHGGFDVVVGNPPYVATTKIDYHYSGFRTDSCPDIYAPCLERASQVAKPDGRLSMIVPMNLSWGGDFTAARAMLTDRFGSIWASTYDQMPSRLFEGVGTRNTIVFAGPGGRGIHTTSFNKWVAEFRPHLLQTQRYIQHGPLPDPWPKVGHEDLVDLATRSRGGMSVISAARSGRYRLGYKKTANYWISMFKDDPPCLDGNRKPMPQKEVGDLWFRSEEDMYLALAVGTSRTMFLWWVFNGDAFHILGRTFTDFPLVPTKLSDDDKRVLVRVGRSLDERLTQSGEHLLWTPYAGAWYGNFDLNRCRDITDLADDVLLRHFGLDGHRFAFEVEYKNYMKSGGERPGTVRGAQPDRNR